jgi:beta-glucanase (GH16 family)
MISISLYAQNGASLSEAKPGWRLTFHDEFDGPVLNDLYWYPAYRMGRIDYLKRIGADGIYEDPNANYKIENGILKLIIDEKIPARQNKEDNAVSCIATSDHRFGANLNEYQVLEKFSQKYGWFEIRCKTVHGGGVYTAFWLHQTDPTDQEFTPQGKRKEVGDGVVEIDIFEQWGWLHANQADFHIHFTKDAQYTCNFDFDPAADFHTYAVNWEEGKVTYYVDGKQVYFYEGETPQKKMFILVALFHRPDWQAEWTNKPFPQVVRELTYPKEFEVDYVRVYQKE